MPRIPSAAQCAGGVAALARTPASWRGDGAFHVGRFFKSRAHIGQVRTRQASGGAALGGDAEAGEGAGIGKIITVHKICGNRDFHTHVNSLVLWFGLKQQIS